MTQPKTASKFTPGPWHLEHTKHNFEDSGICIESTHGPVGSVRLSIYANARLIAAAPEMYELLETIVADHNAMLANEATTDVLTLARRIKAAIDGETTP